MANRRLVRATVAALAGLALAAAARSPHVRPDLALLLDEYTSGDGGRAVRHVEQIDDEDAIDMRLDWATVGRSWIERDPPNRSTRLFAAAAFALETEAIRVERGQWSQPASRKVKEQGKEHTIYCNGACVLGWARGLFIERGAPDAAEHAWWMASIALAQGIRDVRFLLPPPVTRPPIDNPGVRIAMAMGQIPQDDSAGHLAATLLRFPNDPEARLANAMALAARYDITTDAAPRIPGVGGMGATAAQMNRNRAQLPELVAEFRAIADDAGAGESVRTEARIRLGYLYWATGDNTRAHEALSAAAASAPTADLRYLAHYLAGVALESATEADAAMRAYEGALAARPHSQSATIRLGVLRILQGDAAGAQEIAQDSLDARPTDADPWRLFLYGHYPQFPALLADVRRQVPR